MLYSSTSVAFLTMLIQNIHLSFIDKKGDSGSDHSFTFTSKHFYFMSNELILKYIDKLGTFIQSFTHM